MHHYLLCIIFILHQMEFHIFPYIVTYYYVSLQIVIDYSTIFYITIYYYIPLYIAV